MTRLAVGHNAMWTGCGLGLGGMLIWFVMGGVLTGIWEETTEAAPVSQPVGSADQAGGRVDAPSLGLSDLNVAGLERLRAPRWGRDPFALPSKDVVITGVLNLTAILYRPDSALAIVNGQVVRSGDEIDGHRVVSIGRDHVIVQEGKTTRRLEVPKFTTERGRR